MRKRLSRWAGRFPGKYAAALAVLSGAIKTEDVRVEWRVQIERCLASSLKVRFINSHEHMHMLPPLFPIVRALAKEYGIRHIRFPAAELSRSPSAGALFRGSVMKTLATVNRRQVDMPVAHFLGMEHSGKLNLPYLERRLSKLGRGQVYELMCHPGHRDEEEVRNPRLLGYHDWEGELETLTSPAVKELLHENRVRLIGYRQLEVESGQLTVRAHAG
jgi:predicted glycoside hydrolase/deacetylase ChbG (UPF0249 family)